MKKQIFIFLLLILIQCLIPCSKAQEAAQSSLYDRLSGAHVIASVIDDFVNRLTANPIITTNEKVESAIERISKAGLKFHLTELVCEEAGGPQKYTGRSMKESHKDLNIREEEWQAMMKDFLATLGKFNVPVKEQNELLAIVAKTKADIVIAKAPEPQVKVPEPEVQEAEVEEPKTQPEIPGLPGLPMPKAPAVP